MPPAELAATASRSGSSATHGSHQIAQKSKNPLTLVGRQGGVESLQVDHADLRLRATRLGHAREQEAHGHRQQPLDSDSV